VAVPYNGRKGKAVHRKLHWGDSGSEGLW